MRAPLPYFHAGIPAESQWESDTSHSLVDWIGDAGEGTVVRLEGLAGWGKTTVMQMAARKTGALLVRVPGDENHFINELLLNSTRKVVDLVNGGGNVTVERVLEHLKPLVKQSFWTLLKRVEASVSAARANKVRQERGADAPDKGHRRRCLRMCKDSTNCRRTLLPCFVTCIDEL